MSDARHGQYGIKGQVVNIPIKVPKLIQCLPHNMPEDAAIDVHIKRQLVNKMSYKRGLVKRSNIHAWLKHLETTPLYKCVNGKIDWNQLAQFDGDEAECDDDEIEPLPETMDLDKPMHAAIALNTVSRTLVYGVSSNVHAMSAKPKWALDEDGLVMLQELGSLTAAALLEKVKDLQNLAYKLGIEESREMTRGRFLDILRKDKEEKQEALVYNEDEKCLEWQLCI
ncbi:hypothetical protein HPB50_015934 [Hyalomma asiaticum]|uniref:Uncharacterized protein n=1 Tax=Hyalomma asiaticum TaxID=266040 RepID=A0ACB7S0F3_HYAAI|nr:hypothetical protein HPB50_015934 [Hyalomma asiaticum]